MVFVAKPKVVEGVKAGLDWANQNDEIQSESRYDVRSGHRCCMKTMPITSESQSIQGGYCSHRR